MPSILIIGANRGIGLASAQLYHDHGWAVYGTYRTEPPAEFLGTALALDVGSAESIAAVTKQLDGVTFDILWHNAGVFLDREEKFGVLCHNTITQSFAINTVAPLILTQALYHNVRKQGGTIAFTSSRMGSVTQASTANAYAYRASKAALNMIVKLLGQYTSSDGIKTVALHPGWVRTDMGGASADIDVTTSVSGMKSVLENPDPKDSGLFFNYDGSSIAW
ncbi:MAG: SDR family oxidoreductase [Pseudomonadota bacterium]